MDLTGLIPPPSPFTLSIPGLDYQNAWVDVTGIYGWEHVEVVPAFAGYARYPSWIIQDWIAVPIELRGSRGPDSETSLRNHRREYVDVMTKVDPEVVKATFDSFVFRTVEKAIHYAHLHLPFVYCLSYLADRKPRLSRRVEGIMGRLTITGENYAVGSGGPDTPDRPCFLSNHPTRPCIIER